MFSSFQLCQQCAHDPCSIFYISNRSSTWENNLKFVGWGNTLMTLSTSFTNLTLGQHAGLVGSRNKAPYWKYHRCLRGCTKKAENGGIPVVKVKFTVSVSFTMAKIWKRRLEQYYSVNRNCILVKLDGNIVLLQFWWQQYGESSKGTRAKNPDPTNSWDRTYCHTVEK